MESLTGQQESLLLSASKDLRDEPKVKFNKAIAAAIKEHELKEDKYRDSVLSLESKHESKRFAFKTETSRYRTELVQYNEKVTKLTGLISDYFGESFMLDVRAFINDRQYEDAIDSIINKIFNTKSKNQKSFLKSIIDKCSYYSTMNLHLFINALNVVYSMLDECGIIKNEDERLENLIDIIRRGDNKSLKSILELTTFNEYGYEATIYELLKCYDDKPLKK